MAKRKLTNGIDTDAAAGIIKSIEGCEAEILSERGTYMARAKAIRGDIKEIYQDARDNGIPTKALKAIVKARVFERKRKALADGLDENEATAFEQLEEALGGLVELPLGQAAMDAQRKRDAKEFTDAEFAANPDPFPEQPQTEAARTAAE